MAGSASPRVEVSQGVSHRRPRACGLSGSGRSRHAALQAPAPGVRPRDAKQDTSHICTPEPVPSGPALSASHGWRATLTLPARGSGTRSSSTSTRRRVLTYAVLTWLYVQTRTMVSHLEGDLPLGMHSPAAESNASPKRASSEASRRVFRRDGTMSFRRADLNSSSQRRRLP
jgi:hypothetical protein